MAGGCMPFFEPFTLFFRYPGFGKFTVLTLFLAAGNALPAMYVIPQLQQSVWKDHATANSQWIGAVGALLGVIFSPFFGRWSDKNSRRTANLILGVASNCPPLVLLIFGRTAEGLWIYVALWVLLKPISLGASGSPVCWAYLTDQLPPEHRVLGFAVNGGTCALGNVAVQLASKFLADQLPENQRPEVFLWVTAGNILFYVLCIGWMGPDKPREAMHDGAVVSDTDAAVCSILSPLRLLMHSRTLLFACLVSALITLPDVAATGVSAQVLYQLLNITGENTAAQETAMMWFGTWPQVPAFFAFMAVGLVGEHVGAPVLVKCWLPVVCVLFAAPTLLLAWTSNGAVLAAGCCMAMAGTCFAPIQALVALVVPQDQVGEAMGTMGACKNVVSFLAPLLMASITQALANAHRNDLLWVIFPVSAFVMLCAWPFTFLLEIRKDDEALLSSKVASIEPQRGECLAPQKGDSDLSLGTGKPESLY